MASVNKINKFILFLFMHTHFYFFTFFFLFFLFYCFFGGWAGLNPAQHIYWWLGSAQPHRGWARPNQPGPVTGPSQWPAGQTADARVQHFHACINSAKVIKLPSHCSNAIWTQHYKRGSGRTCFWRWWRNLQRRCSYCRSIAFFSFPVVATVFLSFDFSVLGMKKLRR